MKRIFILLVVISIFSIESYSQYYGRHSEMDRLSLGVGAGFDYGGFGGNILYYPTPHIGVFGGFGHAMVDPGYNVGIKLRYLPRNPNKLTKPYFMAMYGYNTSIYVENSTYSKIYYGVTVGVGLDFHSMRRLSYWTIALTVPIRTSEAYDYVRDLERNGVEFETPLLPIGFSVAYRFAFD